MAEDDPVEAAIAAAVGAAALEAGNDEPDEEKRSEWLYPTARHKNSSRHPQHRRHLPAPTPDLSHGFGGETDAMITKLFSSHSWITDMTSPSEYMSNKGDEEERRAPIDSFSRGLS